MIQEAKDAGVHVLTSREEFDSLDGGVQAELPIMGIFAPRTISYEIERDPKLEPSLLDMTKTALETLKRATVESEKGFIIVSTAFSFYQIARLTICLDDRGIGKPIPHIFDLI